MISATILGCGSGAPPPSGAGTPSSTRVAELIVEAGRVIPRPGSAIEDGAVAIADGRIVAVGSSRDVRARVGRITRVIEVPGGVILPGLCDAHGHLVSLGESLETLSLIGTRSLDDVLSRVESAARVLASGEWLVGRGWDQNDWPPSERAFPDRRRLDAVVGDRAVVLERVDGHAVWASSAALAAAGLDDSDPDPPGGRMIRREDGSLTGVLVDAAASPLQRAIPAVDDATRRRRAMLAARLLASKGNTGLHDMGVPPRTAELLLAMGEAGEVPIRLHMYLDGSDAETDAMVARGPRRRGLVSLVGVKYFLDGALGSRGAALLEPYSDEPSSTGLLVTAPEVLAAKARTAMEHGMQVAVHAIGDRANRIAIEVLGDLARELPRALRPRIEHAQVLAADDLPRLGQRGLVASMQPIHCSSDMPWAPDRLGQGRLVGAYAWRSILGGGAVVAFGSDCPVEAPDPLEGLFVATTRRRPGSDDRTTPYPPAAERLDLAQALAAFTSAPAEAVGEGRQRGGLAVGQDADLTVLDSDPFAARRPPDALLRARIAYTIVAGRVVAGD